MRNQIYDDVVTDAWVEFASEGDDGRCYDDSDGIVPSGTCTFIASYVLHIIHNLK
jgi:hypothetical protein